MKLNLMSLAAVAAALALPSATMAQEAGDYALAQWQGGTKWYPGVVMSRTGSMVKIQYDDGTKESRPANQVKPFTWRPGVRVECKFTDGEWYGAAITTMGPDGVSLTVRYDDAVVEQTLTSKCRS